MVDIRLSVEDTNRIRARLGLKLIPTNVTSSIVPPAAPQKVETPRVVIPQVTDSPGLASTVESTSSWLARLKKSQASKPDVQLPVPQPVVSEPNVTSEPIVVSETKVTSQPIVVSETKVTSRPNIESHLDVKLKESEVPKPTESKLSSSKKAVDTYDPLDVDHSVERAPKQPGLDYDMSKAIKFKPKKIKKDQNRRNRNQELASGVDELRKSIEAKLQEEHEKEDEHAIKMISTQRLAKQKLANPDTKQSVPSRSGSGLVVSETSRFLENIKRKVTQTPSPDQSPPAHIEIDDMEVAHEEPPEPQDAEEIEKSHMGGVADVLKLLQKRGAVEPTKPSGKVNREWSRKLTQQRQARQSDLLEQAKAWEHLPARERRELMELQNKQAALEEAEIAQQQFAEYDPEVQITYTDSRGEVIDRKEAFKELSRKFHGTAEGKRRAERRKRRTD